MARNGSGTYTLPSGNPVVTGTSISSTTMNNTLTDIATALTGSLSADGQTPMSGNLSAANNKITSLAAGSAAGNSLRWEQLFDQGAEADLASATTTDIGAQTTNFLRITGTTTITSFGANYKGPRFLRFAGALTLTHNASTLILPGGASITTAAGDTCVAIPLAAGWYVTQYTRAVVNSMVRLNTANGYGSTNTVIRRFTTVVTNTGADITFADSSTLGATFTINSAGMYAISYTDFFNGVSSCGISLNSSQLTTSIGSITAADRLAMQSVSGADLAGTASTTLYLAAGSVIRAHANGTPSGSGPGITQFTIARVA